MKDDGRYCSGRCTQAARRARLRKPVVVAEPDSHDLAWAAGFFDGEGSFTASRSTIYETTEGPKARRYLRLSVSQKYRELPDRLVSIFGVGKVYGYKARPTSSGGFNYVCNGRTAFYVANLLWPWLSEQKKADFKRVLARVLESRRDFVRQPQRGNQVVAERS